MSERRPIVGGNWKMNLLKADAADFCRRLTAGLGAAAAEVVLFPPFPLLDAVVRGVGSSTVAVGGQDVHPEAAGAYTGDTSALLLRDVGCTWALCGHSERRRDHGEDDELVARKATAAVAAGLLPMICVGETAEERRAGRTLQVLETQLDGALSGRPDPFVIAYEPVWAIGTGDTATPEIAQEAHRHIREVLADLVGEPAAAAKRILYGGSANPDNAAELIAQPDVDGFLVGGASLDPDRFLAIISACGS
ncbi:MAG: triose-phosphate isomerase [Thermoanaerobaculia bacterium]|nr:triose-phosphate isomerase [Thermoanaerobaculia bacterium]